MWGPGCTYLRATKNNYTSWGSEPPNHNWNAGLSKQRGLHGNQRPVSSAKGAGSTAKQRLRKALRRREFHSPQRRRYGMRPGSGRARCSAISTYHEDAGHRAGGSGQKSKLGVRRPTSHSPAAGWVTSGRALPLGLGLPQVYSGVGMDDASRSSQPRAGPGPPSLRAGPARRRSESFLRLSRPGGLKGLGVGGGAWTQCPGLAPRGGCVQPGAVAGHRARSQE